MVDVKPLDLTLTSDICTADSLAVLVLHPLIHLHLPLQLHCLHHHAVVGIMKRLQTQMEVIKRPQQSSQWNFTLKDFSLRFHSYTLEFQTAVSLLTHVWKEYWHSSNWKQKHCPPERFAAVQTNEPNGCCSAGRGWGENPKTQSGKGPQPEKMLFAAPDPKVQTQRAHTKSVSHNTIISHDHCVSWLSCNLHTPFSTVCMFLTSLVKRT